MMSSAPASILDPDTWFNNDDQFHHLYPARIQALATRHWTPLHITWRVARYLAPTDNSRVLDIGSGVGKFCLAAAHCMPSAVFFGVEQRRDLVAHAEFGRKLLGLENARFIHGNFTQLDFKQYDHFYFYNSFYENLAATDKIDDNIEVSTALYNYYNRYLYRKLNEMPTGTRLVTYHSLEEEIPPSYQLVEAQVECLLKFWIKT
jgi:SAM-dependent methyltransferase